MQALQIAASGMVAQQHNTEVVANNLANMNTSGYQRRRTEFHDLLYNQVARKDSVSSRAGDVVPSGVQQGHGVRLASIYRIAEQGNLQSTDNSFDLAIQGRGYFQVLLPNGDTAYTRAGAFQLNGQGQLVTQDGFTVQPGILIPPGAVDVTINATGEVLVKLDGATVPTNAGTLQITTFPNEAGLIALGDNLFRESRASGPANAGPPGSAGFGSVLQGFIETSNVDPVTEIAALIAAQRAYEMNSKVIQTADQMLAPSRN
ncbi:MAG: flagellar basal-body rod protein FlgG [Rhodospirillales bacterium]|nr:flagellar basal-body rod protein FlgG [Rhodospirillales bacterium]MBI2586748.1 flagellar basal-body rod protein FlgG [Rhodospirillales bacterium]